MPSWFFGGDPIISTEILPKEKKKTFIKEKESFVCHTKISRNVPKSLSGIFNFKNSLPELLGRVYSLGEAERDLGAGRESRWE